MNQNIRAYMASIGSKGGKRSKRSITPEQQKLLILARKKKLKLRKKLNDLIIAGDWEAILDLPDNKDLIVGILLTCIQKAVFTPNYFTALQKMSGENPVPDRSTKKVKESDIPAIASAWVEWGIQKRLIRRV